MCYNKEKAVKKMKTGQMRAQWDENQKVTVAFCSIEMISDPGKPV
jgi:hypothetical protein